MISTTQKEHTFFVDLQKKLRGEIRSDPYSRLLYSTDASIYQMDPIGVVIPQQAEDVSILLESAFQNGIAVLPRGGGTSLAGQTVNQAVVLDFSKYMNHVIEINAEEGWVRTQPGITIEELNHHLKPHGLHFAPDPTTSNRATIGGAIGNNSCGAHSILYGKTSEQVLEVDVLLSNGTPCKFEFLSASTVQHKMSLGTLEGEIYRGIDHIVDDLGTEIAERYPRILRRVSGYNLDHLTHGEPFDLARLIVGSEGTLATIVSAKLRVFPLPAHKGLAVIHFTDLIEAMEATVHILEHSPSAIELMDRMIIYAARSSTGFAQLASMIQDNPAAVLAVEFFADSLEQLEGHLDNLKQAINQRRLGYSTLIIKEPEAQEKIWALRRAGLGLLMGKKGDVKPLPFVEDTAVAPEHLPNYIKQFDALVRDQGTTAAYYGHASVGCLHVRPLINLKEQEGLDRMVSIARDVSDLVLKFGGALSGEHGDGIVRGVWNEKMFGTELYQAFGHVKSLFDPQGIMNPGKIVNCPPMTENLRFGPGYRPLQIETVLDFSKDFGFSGAVELCNGVGACRKTLGGTMCPSYMVTREEEHSTRGRANILQGVLSGKLPASEFASQRMHDVLDLCLGCKACKNECPSNVDMAKLKSEFLHHYHASQGTPLRTRLFAHIATVNRVATKFRALSNFAMRSSFVKWIFEWFLGIDRRRPLPQLASTTFEEWFKGRTPLESVETKGKVAFLCDTFTNYHRPEVGQATVGILEALGYEVLLPDRPCCGRTMISKGLLEDAKIHALRNVDLLYPYVQAGVKVIGIEPSCVLTFRDDYLDLLPDYDKVKVVAEGTLLLEEFLLEIHDAGEMENRFNRVDQHLVFFPHCHQKALLGSEPSLNILRLVPGQQVRELDSGCCGMAGSFGHEIEHYNLSMSIGESRLFPAIEEAQDCKIVTNGFSCQQQIEDGTGRKTYHIAQVLAEALGINEKPPKKP